MDSKSNSNDKGISKTILIRYWIREILGTLFIAVVLFLSSGRLDWIMGWALFGITLLWVIATAAVLIQRNPRLIAERLGPKKGSKTWDTAIMSTVGLAALAKLLLAGLDIRNSWTTEITLPCQLAALIVAILAYSLAVWATAVNAYFSQIVRIQKDRGHKVCKEGPYQIIRHPGYLGTLLFELSTPIMLGSLWALIPGLIAAILFIIRTFLEDKTLNNELDGYEEYTQQVRHRLIPGIW